MKINKIILLLVILYNINCEVLVCKTPNSSTDDKCSACDDHQEFTFDHRNCLSCADTNTQAIILTSNFEKCYTKIDNCQDYLDYDDFCKTCNAGYERDEFGKCNKECKDNQTWKNNVCFNNIEKCEDYELFKEGQKCTRCSIGYKLNSAQTKCIKCPDEFTSNGKYCICKEDNQAEFSGKCYDLIEGCEIGKQIKDTCQKCSINYKIVENSGKKTCIACITESKIGNGKICYSPITNCAEYTDTGNCQKCSPNFKLEGNSCIECNLETEIIKGDKCYAKIENCAEYSNTGACLKCSPNFKLEGNSCTDCTTDSKIGNGNICYTQIENCAEYSNTGACLKCNPNFKLEGNSCTDCTTDSKIGNGLICYTSITGCAEYSNTGVCLKCNPNFKLEDNSGTQQCIGCTTEIRIGNGNICYTSITNCAEYTNAGVCQKCNPNFKLVDNSCVSCAMGETGDGNKCFKCINENGERKCFEKIDNCIEQTEDKCLQCDSDYELSTDKTRCTSCTDGKKSDGIVSCFKIDNCKTYNYYEYGSNKIYGCSTCVSNSFYLTTAKQQCNIDALGKYKLGTNLINEINNCLEQKSQTECTKCLPGYKIKNGKCYPCVEPYKGIDGKTCYLPHLGCYTDESGKCLLCENGYKLTKNKQYCYLEGTNDPTNNSCNLFKLNILLLMLFGLLI